MSGRAFNTGINLLGQKGTNAANGTASTDLATYGQLLALVNGLDWKQHVRAASPVNVSLTAPGSTMDGVTLAAGDRVFLPNQTDQTANLVYIWNGASTALTIAPDFVNGELGPDATLSIAEGSTYADKSYTLTTNGPITVGTTTLQWAQNNAATVYTAANGILISGYAISVDPSKVVQKYATTIGDGTTKSFNITHNLNNADAMIRAYLISTGEDYEADVSARTANGFTMTFGTAPVSSGVRVVVQG